VEDVVESVMVADPLRVLDCSPITDGAAAVVIAALPLKETRKAPVKVAASAAATDTIGLHDRDDLAGCARPKWRRLRPTRGPASRRMTCPSARCTTASRSPR